MLKLNWITDMNRWPLYMRIETLALALDVSPSKLRTLIRMGHLPEPEIIGDVERWSLAAVDEHIRRHCGAGESRDNADPYSQGVADAKNNVASLRLQGTPSRP
jgi:predicted DNA-binding transcriptional regulator AlpA